MNTDAAKLTAGTVIRFRPSLVRNLHLTVQLTDDETPDARGTMVSGRTYVVLHGKRVAPADHSVAYTGRKVYCVNADTIEVVFSPEAEAKRLSHLEERRATMRRAIAWLDEHDSYTIGIALSCTRIWPHLLADPKLLIESLTEGLTTESTFGHWKAAQQICQAAGLEY